MAVGRITQRGNDLDSLRASLSVEVCAGMVTLPARGDLGPTGLSESPRRLGPGLAYLDSVKLPPAGARLGHFRPFVPPAKGGAMRYLTSGLLLALIFGLALPAVADGGSSPSTMSGFGALSEWISSILTWFGIGEDLASSKPNGIGVGLEPDGIGTALEPGG